ncbi:NtaA/DmoA family FMN-dependent monooxygenase [Nocardioides sp. Kera G14]|uniref:NtaA/DmoA family FMN-dependent monooxygenase n=1 Tax=Nocardioides sp. Kera G14 TaxID=2884264 RepID=UPI001D11DEFA|nr:NtaA/DmoA family FMN-dependent monooxygenase [Nocardioides sp. Kera G14]UDY24380.1 NtaA/DmoA family FMN-dependent monooxygenase [Nocardioides sp. Kera G14]
MRLGVFEVAGAQVGGTLSWPHPRATSVRYHELDYWIEYAQLLDRAGFDFLFFADGYGYPTLGGDLAPAAWRDGINFSGLEPMLLIPTLARETERLGFVVTASTGLDHPVQTARRFGSLDHLTDGRIGWNVVTGASQNVVAELFGHDTMARHDDRYAAASEYVDLTTQLMETVWDDDALLMDRETGVFARREGLHRLEFEGEHFRSSGYFTVDPSPQRSPVLFQAGTSPAGRELAAQWAEAVFVQGTTPAHTAGNVADIRDRAAAHGRPAPITMCGVTITVAETTEEAKARRAEFDAMQNDDVVNALYAGNTGIDLLALDPDGTLEQVVGTGVVGQMGTSNIERFLGPDAPTVRQIIEDLRGKGTRGFQVTGSPSSVVDQLEELMEATGLDGFLLEPVFALTDVVDFAEMVVPELRARGHLPGTPRSGTLRGQLGVGSPANGDHRRRTAG